MTVQMAGGGSKTLTLMPQQQGITQVGKIVRIPATSGSGTDQPKLMVVQRAKQGTATIAKAAQINNHTTLTALTATTTASTSFDGPATTDAALAALAAEAGLIDPEPQKDSTPVVKAEKAEPMETESNGEVEKKEGGAVATAQETAAVGLLGGTAQEKLGLKGGSKFRLGLFGGSPSPVGPPTEKVSYRGGLLGGGGSAQKDSPGSSTSGSQSQSSSGSQSQSSSGSQSQTSDGSVNGTKKDDDDVSVKMEIDEDAADSALDTSGYGTATTASNNGDDDIMKEEGDALAALASAALDHSKELIKQKAPTPPRQTPDIKPPPIPSDDKDNWFTVGFIKGNSFDVQNYCFCEDNIADYTSDDLPDLSNLQRVSLEPGTAYKFRVAAINSVGRGEWSEVSHKNFKILLLIAY